MGQDTPTLPKKAALWKYVALEQCCIKREFAIYCELAANRRFDCTRLLYQTVERFWQAAATGYSINEKYLLAIEESRFKPRDDWEALALDIVQDLYDFFYAVVDKQVQSLLAMQERPLRLIARWAKLADVSPEPFIQAELARQQQLAQKLAALPNKEKRSFLQVCKEQDYAGLLGEAFLQARPPVTPEKPEKKKLPDIRFFSLDHERSIRWYQSRGAYRDEALWQVANAFQDWPAFLARTGKMTREEYMQTEPEFLYVRRDSDPDYIDFAGYMKLCYSLIAQRYYLLTQDAAGTRGYCYLSALATLRYNQLYRAGVPVLVGCTRYNLQQKRFGIFSGILHAICAGEDALAEQILQYSQRQSIEGLPLLLLHGEDETVRKLLTHPDNDEWWGKCYQAILDADEKELKKQLLQGVRDDRNTYDQMGVTVDFPLYALLQIAARRGMQTQIACAELMGSETNLPPVDKERFLLPGDEVMRRLLQEHGVNP